MPDCRSYVGYRGALQGKSAHTVWVGDVADAIATADPLSAAVPDAP